MNETISQNPEPSDPPSATSSIDRFRSKNSYSVFLLILAFTCGAGVMALEIAGQRALSPHFGASNIVWANLIGVLMGSIALGYVTGGRLADRRPDLRVLLIVLAIAGVWTGLIARGTHVFGRLCVPEGIAAEHSFRINLIGSLLGALLLLAPPVFLLSMSPPFLVRLLSKERTETGRQAGRVNGWSTIGSLTGTFSPTLILIPLFGSGWTLFIIAATITSMACLGLLVSLDRSRRIWAAAPLLGLFPGVFLAGGPVHSGENVLEERESAYQYIRVDRRDDATYLTMNEGRDQYHSLRIEGQVLTDGKYFDYLNLVPLHFDPEWHPRLRVCLIGFAAGIYSRQLHHFYSGMFTLEIDGAEIDPDVLEMGRRYFQVGGPEHANLKAVAADGRLFLKASRGAYDLVVVDAYSRQLYIPFHLVTEEFFQLCHDRLSEGGFLAMNVCEFTAKSPALEAIRNTAAGVFGQVHLLRLPGTMNWLLYARKGSLPAGVDQVNTNLDHPAFASQPEAPELKRLLQSVLPYRTSWPRDPAGTIITDDRAPIDSLMDRSFRRVRGSLRW